jgi:hypothetical protein
MTGKVKKIEYNCHHKRKGFFTRVEFMIKGEGWAKADFFNGSGDWNGWYELIKVGKLVHGIVLKKKGDIDVSKVPVKIRPPETKRWVEMDDGSMALEDIPQVKSEDIIVEPIQEKLI